jgi:hypothetical protein
MTFVTVADMETDQVLKNLECNIANFARLLLMMISRKIVSQLEKARLRRILKAFRASLDL